MERQNLVIAAVAVVVLVAVGAFFLWPEGADQAAVVAPEPAATAENGGTASTDATVEATDETTTGTESENPY